jgi:hypothetical protein
MLKKSDFKKYIARVAGFGIKNYNELKMKN